MNSKIRSSLFFLLLSATLAIAVFTFANVPIAAPNSVFAQVQPPWITSDVATGFKPSLAIDSKGNPHIAFMNEAHGTDGWVKYASFDGKSWSVTTVATGYFYGPLALTIDSNDIPHIVWHHHDSKDDTVFPGNPTGGGNQAHAFLQDGKWFVEDVKHPGHDGWDNSVVVGKDGIVRTAAVEPASFGNPASLVGLEYAERSKSGQWTVERVDSVPTFYSWGTSIDVNQDGTPVIAYYDDTNKDLKFATKVSGSWKTETVDSKGDVGAFPSVKVDRDGVPVIAYLERTAGSEGQIKVAKKTGASWTIETVDRLDSIFILASPSDKSGARNTISLNVDSKGQLQLMYSDQAQQKYAVKSGGAWKIETTLQPPNNAKFSQLTSFRLDANNMPQVAYVVLSGERGTIQFAKRTEQSSLSTPSPSPTTNVPNPAKPAQTTLPPGPATTQRPSSPALGDNTALIVSIIVIAVVAGVGGVLAGRRKKKGS